ncbi:hypothetical protein [Halobacillus sp. Marseille-Q1614]|uniref:hypothetical protein n=1 Tax=Halobacillus sp. Marseille-Q1614 TaxID=2709134 RepID=UPI00156FAC53|nr:hypothetical protein [Halobacillus sp. Marseille-Q1614]
MGNEEVEEKNKILKNPRMKTVKRLFSLSQNQCAFSKCTESLVTPEGKVTGKICHIKARNERGPRYDPLQSDEERHGFENLIILCPTHHDIIDDDEKSYTVERLIEIKKEHENKSNNPIDADTDTINAFIQNIYTNNEINIEYKFQNNSQIAQTIINYTVLDTPNKNVRVSCNRVKINIEQIRNDLAQRQNINAVIYTPLRNIDREKYYSEISEYLNIEDSTTFISFYEKVDELNEFLKGFIKFSQDKGFQLGTPVAHAGFNYRKKSYFSFIEELYNEDVNSLLQRLLILGH